MNPSAPELAHQLAGCQFVSAEFMYRPRPKEPHARQVFDFALNSRLTELSRYHDSAVLLICNSQATIESFADLAFAYPRLQFVSAIVNPSPVAYSSRDSYTETPIRGEWVDPSQWRRYDLTDR